MRQTSAPRLRAVIDTNLFVSGAISAIGSPRALLRQWLDGDFDLVLSDAHAAEVIDVFGRPWLRARYDVPEVDLATFLGTLMATPRVQPLSATPIPVRDVKDEMILAAAIGGGADYLVTGDDDLLVLTNDSRIGMLQIVTAAAFIGILSKHLSDKPKDRQ